MAIYTPLINKNNKSQFGMFKAAVPTDTDLVIASGATGFQSLGGGSSGPGGNDGIAQEFTTTSTGLYAITVDIAKVGSPTDNLVMKIVSSINSSTIIATSNEIVGSSLTTTRTARTFFFPSNVTLLSNTDYFFRITRTGASNASNYYTISSDSGNPYSGNTAYELETIWLTLTGVDIKCTIHTAFNYGVGTNAIQLPSDIKSLWATYKENPSISALNSNYTPSFGTTLIEKVAQSFTNISGALASVILWLNCSNVIDQTQVRLCSDSSGSPGSTIATSNAQTITSGSYSPYTFVFSASPTLSSGTIYWLVLERTGSINNTDNYSMYGSTVSIYSDGSVKIYTSSSWVTDTMVDFRFIMYTEPGIVHITTQETSGRVSYHQFNTSTDTWSIVSELVTNATAPASADCAVSHSVRSDGSVVCAYQSGTSAVYKIRSSGGTWGSESSIATSSTLGGLAEYTNETMATNVFWTSSSGTLAIGSINSSGTFSSSGDTGLGLNKHLLSVISKGGYCSVSYRGSLGQISFLRRNETAGTNLTNSVTSGSTGKTVNDTGLALPLEYGGESFSMFVNVSNDDLYLERTPAGSAVWNNPVVLLQEGIVTAISANTDA